MIRQVVLALTAFSHKPVEGATKLHQARAFVLEYVPDRSILELGMPDLFGVGDALIFQPRIQLGQALHSGLGRNIWSRRLPTWFST